MDNDTLRRTHIRLHDAFGEEFDGLLNMAIDAGRECASLKLKDDPIGQLLAERIENDTVTGIFLNRFQLFREKVRLMHEPALIPVFDHMVTELFATAQMVPEKKIQTAEAEAKKCAAAVMAR